MCGAALQLGIQNASKGGALADPLVRTIACQNDRYPKDFIPDCLCRSRTLWNCCWNSFSTGLFETAGPAPRSPMPFEPSGPADEVGISPARPFCFRVGPESTKTGPEALSRALRFRGGWSSSGRLAQRMDHDHPARNVAQVSVQTEHKAQRASGEAKVNGPVNASPAIALPGPVPPVPN